jgi:GH24 family phage-related lysozyme (muramidase)
MPQNANTADTTISYYDTIKANKAAAFNNIIYQSDLLHQSKVAGVPNPPEALDYAIQNNSFYLIASGKGNDTFALADQKKFLITDPAISKNTKVNLNLGYLNTLKKGKFGDLINYLAYSKTINYETIKSEVGVSEYKANTVDAFNAVKTANAAITSELTPYDSKANSALNYASEGIGFAKYKYKNDSPNGMKKLAYITWIQYIKNGIKYRVELTIPGDIPKIAGDQVADAQYESQIRPAIISALNSTDPWEVDSTLQYNAIAINEKNVESGGFVGSKGSNNEVKSAIYKDTGYSGKDPAKLGLLLKKTLPIKINSFSGKDVSATGQKVAKLNDYSITIGLRITDAALITNFKQIGVDGKEILGTKESQAGVDAAAQNSSSPSNTGPTLVSPEAVDMKAIANQVESALRYQSNLELAVKAIQLYCLTNAISESGATVGNMVKSFPLTNAKNRKFFDKVFKYGVTNKIIGDLIDKKVIEDEKFGTEETYITNLIIADDLVKLKLFAKYGFSSAYISAQAEGSYKIIDKVPAVNYEDLCTAYVIPYDIDQTIDGGVNITHPTYIQLGFLLMIMNEMCTIYETLDGKDDDKENKPLFYIDYNPESNLCLSNPLQFTSNAFDFLIPFQGTLAEYKDLFPEGVVKDNKIVAPSDGESQPLFDPATKDAISKNIPKFRAENNSDAYRGKTMKVLVSCSYILDKIKQFAQKDGMNSVYFKPFLEQLLKDMNKSLGGINAFRVAYNDSANTFCIVDSQVQPLAPGETAISQLATDELPIYGGDSIAKTISIQTDIGSKLSNMVAISANKESNDKSANSANASSIGFINNAYTDRYIPIRKDQSEKEIRFAQGAQARRASANRDSLLSAAQKFNMVIGKYYGNSGPSRDNVKQATNYYIERMSKRMNDPGPTRSSAMIPLSVNFTMDGMSGFEMGHSFTIPPNLLPYTYSTRQTPEINAVQDPKADYKVAFVAVGVTHTIQNNVWNTDIKGSMIMIKDQKVFNADINKVFGKQTVDQAPIIPKPKPAININAFNAQNETLGAITGTGWAAIAANFIASQEGYISKAAWDQGNYRGGYGSDRKLVNGKLEIATSETTWTKQEATDTLQYEMQNVYGPEVRKYIGTANFDKLNDNQKAALVSLGYNAGPGFPTKEYGKSIRAGIESNDYQAAAEGIKNGPVTGAEDKKVYPALIKRRNLEAQLFLR